jgi:deazaflavin-dependent oxidoreductase (nitroreductase family)
MAKTFQMNWQTQLFNSIVTGLIRLGVPVGSMALLTVPGRKTGQPRSTPIAILEYEGKSYVITPYGAVNWVRNLRAAGRATLRRRGRTDAIVAVELAATDAAPILQHAISRMPSFLRPYFDVTPSSSLEDFEREAASHPTFRLDTVVSVAGRPMTP